MRLSIGKTHDSTNNRPKERQSEDLNRRMESFNLDRGLPLDQLTVLELPSERRNCYHVPAFSVHHKYMATSKSASALLCVVDLSLHWSGSTFEVKARTASPTRSTCCDFVKEPKVLVQSRFMCISHNLCSRYMCTLFALMSLVHSHSCKFSLAPPALCLHANSSGFQPSPCL